MDRKGVQVIQSFSIQKEGACLEGIRKFKTLEEAEAEE